VPLRWTETDWDQDRPSVEDVIGSWKEIEWESSPVRLPAVERYLECVSSTHVNGGYLWGRWKARKYSDVTSWFAARNRFEEYELLRVLFDSAVVREDLRELQIPDEVGRLPGQLREEWSGSLCLDGILAHVLIRGGAYERFRGPARDAKDIAAHAVDALTDRRYEEFRLDISHEAWTPWFHDIGWDHTLVLTDLARSEITVLCITDTD
jgi:hypothetical protein